MIVITAASGRLGKAVADELEKIVPVKTIRLAARTTEKLDDYKERGFTVVKADYDRKETLDSAFEGAETVMLISGEGPNDLRFRQHKDAIDSAKKAGVKRIVYTSVVNPSHSSRFIWAGAHADTEAYLKKSGIAYTLLRDNPYAANLDDLLVHAKKAGTFAIPGAKGKVAYATHGDIAAAAAKVLTESGHENKVYDMTGPEALTGFDIADMVSDILGLPVSGVEADYDSFSVMFASMGLPQPVIEGLISFYAASGDQEYAGVSAHIESLTGRPATKLRDHIRHVFGKI